MVRLMPQMLLFQHSAMVLYKRARRKIYSAIVYSELSFIFFIYLQFNLKHTFRGHSFYTFTCLLLCLRNRPLCNKSPQLSIIISEFYTLHDRKSCWIMTVTCLKPNQMRRDALGQHTFIILQQGTNYCPALSQRESITMF